MNNKTIIALILGTALTVIVTWFVTSQLNEYDAASKALSEGQIRDVVTAMLVTPDGKSYGQAIQDINTNLTTINTTLLSHEQFRTEIRSDLNSIRQSMIILAGGA